MNDTTDPTEDPIFAARQKVGNAHYMLTEAITDALDAGATWNDVWTRYCGQEPPVAVVRRYDSTSRSALHRAFHPWIRAVRETRAQVEEMRLKHGEQR